MVRYDYVDTVGVEDDDSSVGYLAAEAYASSCGVRGEYVCWMSVGNV